MVDIYSVCANQQICRKEICPHSEREGACIDLQYFDSEPVRGPIISAAE